MVDIEWTQLQNGSDIRGIATEGIIGENINLSVEKVAALGRGFVQWLSTTINKKQLRIAIGMDCRLTSPAFLDALEESITSLGCDVLHCGTASTPAMLLSTQMAEIKADGAIMVTGSHMSFNRNGLKFFRDGLDISRDDMTEIINLAATTKPTSDSTGNVHITNLIALYSRKLRDKILTELSDAEDPKQPLRGLNIVVDAGNGAADFFATRVLKPLGADITGSQFLNPDGRFPNHIPNPEDYEATRSIATAVQYSAADLGILFDSDVDRVAIVDGNGRLINRNALVAMASALVVEEHPGTTIVTDSITTNGVAVFINDILGGRQCRFQRGYRNVINEAKRLNEIGEPCWLAVETSGHAAFKENLFIDDGAYFATKIVIKLARLKREGKTISSLIDKLPLPVEVSEFRLHILESDFTRTAAEAISGLRQYVTQIKGWEVVNRNPEGLRVLCNNDDERGWFLFRLSLHDPVMPLNIESEVKGGNDVIISKLKLFFRNIRSIDSRILYKR